jgi:6-phosphogluconolactonase
MMLSGAEVRIFDNKAAVADATAEMILDLARAAITERGRFRLVLAGGTTPTAAYRLLRDRDTDWAAWHIYHGDERCLAIEDPERNSLAADEAWLRHVPVPPAQIHAIPAELGAELAADAYGPVVAAALPFDLVLLGIGEDGHTASLFPGRGIPLEPLVIPVHDAPKPPPDRVSLTPTALCRSGLMLLLVTGVSKQDALRRWQDGEDLPVAKVVGGGRSILLIDREAAEALGNATTRGSSP